jgi:hypothetical protein
LKCDSPPTGTVELAALPPFCITFRQPERVVPKTVPPSENGNAIRESNLHPIGLSLGLRSPGEKRTTPVRNICDPNGSAETVGFGF